jgi:hypothetical protein
LASVLIIFASCLLPFAANTSFVTSHE